MICLLLLFSLKRIFSFVQIIKRKKEKVDDACLACLSRNATFWRRVRVALVVVTVISSHHLIRLSVLLLSGWHVYSGLTQNYSSFLYFFSFFFFLGLRADHVKNHQPFNLFFLLIQSLLSYLQLYYLHWLFLIEFFFRFHF